MSKVSVGSKIPAFSATTTDGGSWKLADAAGRKVVLYFYPKDMTPGCTVEAREFRDAAADFEKGQDRGGGRVARQLRLARQVPRQGRPEFRAALRRGREALQAVRRDPRRTCTAARCSASCAAPS